MMQVTTERLSREREREQLLRRRLEMEVCTMKVRVMEMEVRLEQEQAKVARLTAAKVRAKRTMRMHRSWAGPPWAQDRCICLPVQARKAHAPILGPG